MSLTDESNGLIMPVSPMYGGNGGMNNFGGDGWWILLLLLFAGGWGNGFGGFGGGMGGFAADGAALYPWMNQAEITNSGFQNAATNQAISSLQNSVTSGFGDVQMALCNGFAGVEQGANARQMANMQQMFSLQSQFADCCCENRLANCQTQNVIQSEASATRFADANNTRDLLTNQTANTQAILDKLCQLELDAKNDKISDLERQLTMANLQASQVAQTASIERGQIDTMNTLVNELRSCPIPSQPVFGMTPIFSCSNNNGCGCNGNF